MGVRHYIKHGTMKISLSFDRKNMLWRVHNLSLSSYQEQDKSTCCGCFIFFSCVFFLSFNLKCHFYPIKFDDAIKSTDELLNKEGVKRIIKRRNRAQLHAKVVNCEFKKSNGITLLALCVSMRGYCVFIFTCRFMSLISHTHILHMNELHSLCVCTR